MRLVRNKIPATYAELKNTIGTEHSFRRVRDQEELALLLRLKLAEGVGEVLSASSQEGLKEELGDLLDVMCALATLNGIRIGRLAIERSDKRLQLGGYLDGWVLELQKKRATQTPS